jgi:hypothetical protein
VSQEAPSENPPKGKRLMPSMTYGVLPSFESFEAAFDRECPDGCSFGRDKRVGNVTLSCSELWREIVKAHDQWEESGDEDAGDWLSCVLGIFGFEWI